MRSAKYLVVLGVFLLLMNGAFAADYYDEHGKTLSNTAGSSACVGLRFNSTERINVTALARWTTSTGTTWYLHNGTATTCSGATKTGTWAGGQLSSTISGGVVVNPGETWTFLTDSGGAAYTMSYGAANDLNTSGNTTKIFYFDGLSAGSKDSYIRNVRGLYFSDFVTGGSSNFSVTATDSFNASALLTLSVTMENGSVQYNFSTSSGTINTTIFQNSTSLWNITVRSNQSGGYHDRTYTNQNVSSNLAASLTKIYRVFNTTYLNHIAYNGSNYTRNITYSINLSCLDSSASNISRYINGAFESVGAFTCQNTSQILTGSYQHSVEGTFNISFYLNTSYRPEENNEFFGNRTFISDLQAPTITVLTFNVTQGFVNPTANVTMVCTDTIFSNLTYNLTFNNVTLFFGNRTNGTTQSNTTTARDGTNVATANCSDPFSSDTETYSATVYTKELQLIDERSNTAFDVANVSSAKAYFDDNSSFYDFKGNATSKINFTSMNDDKVRIELVYASGTVITRYLDVSLVTAPIRICANKEGVTHYEQLIISAVERPVVLKSVYANCLIAADYTRFAYQDALLLKAYSIQAVYYLYTYVDGTQTFLASVDGGVSSYINLDTLEFKQQGYNLNILGEALSFQKTGTDEVTIYYQNLDEDNTALNFVIVRMDTDAVVFNSSDFADLNEFTVVFDYSALNNITNETLFYGLVTRTDDVGTDTVKRYFNAQGSSGSLRSEVAFVIAIFLVMFGLTFTATKFTFGWFGIMVMIASIAVLSFAVTTWYITLLMAIDVILLVFIVILLANQNYSTMSVS